MAKKAVDIQKVSIESDVAHEPVLLEDVLLELSGYKADFDKKSVEIKLWDRGENSDVVSGIVITEQIKDLPPKRNKDTGEFSSLGLQENERLAFGNAFLYDKSLKVIFYEVNGNGCYLDDFSILIKEEWNRRQDGQNYQIIDIDFIAIAKNGGYDQYKRMYYLKEFTFKVVCPQAVLQEYQDKTKAISTGIKTEIKKAVDNNADIMEIHYATMGKKTNKQGLDANKISKLVKACMFILNGRQRTNVQTLKVVGYETNPEGSKGAKTADLIADLLKGSINLPTVVQQRNLQEDSRKTQIESLHNSSLAMLRNILGSVE